MWSGSPRSSWCPLCAVEVCVRTSMAWSSVSLLCVSFGWTRRFLRRIFVVAPLNVSFATCNSEPGGGKPKLFLPPRAAAVGSIFFELAAAKRAALERALIVAAVAALERRAAAEESAALAALAAVFDGSRALTNPTLEHYELRYELRYEKGIRNALRAS